MSGSGTCARTVVGTELVVCSTHLVPGNVRADVRARQLAEVATTPAGHAGPKVLLGDLNDYPAAASMSRLYAAAYGAGASGAYVEGGSTRAGRPCRCGALTYGRVELDYAFVSARHSTAAPAAVEDAPYSDHAFLWAPLVAR